MTDKDTLTTDHPEKAVTTEQVYARLSGLPLELQEKTYNDWLDRTLPGRITATMFKAMNAARNGDKMGERAYAMQAAVEDQQVNDYVRREAEGKLTAEEIATKEALARLFPDGISA